MPEAVVLSGAEDLSGFSVIVLPYATCFPQGLASRLLSWVRRGGLLVCAGAPGMFDKYGFADGSLTRSLFGETFRADYTGQGRKWRWRYAVDDGEYRRIVDLGIGSHCGVPLAPRADAGDGRATSPPNRTMFQLRLAPGEATVFRLVK